MNQSTNQLIDPETKRRIYAQCLQLVEEKIRAAQSVLNDLAASIANETKSTAGDKYETARAMLHIEQENAGKQLAVLNHQLSGLRSVDISRVSSVVMNGSLVGTDKGSFFLSIPLGKIIVDEIPVYVLSPEAPLAGKLLGCAVNDSIEMNGKQYLVQSIC